MASTFVTVAVDPCHRHDDEKVRRRVEEAANAWRDRVATNHRAFIGTRLLREQAMAVERVLLQGPGSAGLFQPGLFERRDERAHMVVVDAQAAAEREEVERLARIERAGALSFLAPNLLLALTS